MMHIAGYAPPTTKDAEDAEIRRTLRLPGDGKVIRRVLDEARTKVHHKLVANPFFLSLATGGFCQTSFTKYLKILHPIHIALEDAQMRVSQVAYLAGCVTEDLFRSEAIQQDLVIWEKIADDKIIEVWELPSAAVEFADYIRKTADEDPERIIAIMYCLYGTIMSGGQTNRKVVAAALESARECYEDIPEGSGVKLFELQGDVAAYKKEWHINLCAIEQGYPKAIRDLHEKLTTEVVSTLEKILSIVEDAFGHIHC